MLELFFCVGYFWHILLEAAWKVSVHFNLKIHAVRTNEQKAELCDPICARQLNISVSLSLSRPSRCMAIERRRTIDGRRRCVGHDRCLVCGSLAIGSNHLFLSLSLFFLSLSLSLSLEPSVRLAGSPFWELICRLHPFSFALHSISFFSLSYFKRKTSRFIFGIRARGFGLECIRL